MGYCFTFIFIHLWVLDDLYSYGCLGVLSWRIVEPLSILDHERGRRFDHHSGPPFRHLSTFSQSGNISVSPEREAISVEEETFWICWLFFSWNRLCSRVDTLHRAHPLHHPHLCQYVTEFYDRCCP